MIYSPVHVFFHILNQCLQLLHIDKDTMLQFIFSHTTGMKTLKQITNIFFTDNLESS